MSEEKPTFITKPRNLAEIIDLADASALEIFMDDPLPVIAQTTMELLANGRGAFIGRGVRIVQAALKGRLFKQLASEVKALKEKGKIDEKFAEKKYGYQSWVELLTIIDEDGPDQDRLEALKAMFYSINKANATDGQQILGYQLFQIAKRLSSNELLVLKAVSEIRKATGFHAGWGFVDWAQAVSRHLGHNVVSLIDHADKALVENQLLTERVHSDRSGVQLVQQGRMTDLGIKFCENIEHYQAEKKTE